MHLEVVRRRGPMMLVCMAQAGCALSPESPIAPTPPQPEVLQRHIQEVSVAQKLPAPLLVSPLRAAHPISPAEWIVCLKSSAPDEHRRYAVFMRNNELIAVRLAVLIDNCDHEPYQPVGKAS